MADRGAPLGNTNASNGVRWRNAIDKALDKRSKAEGQKDLVELAEVMLQAVENGESWAFKEMGDRLDGKPHQTVTNEGSVMLVEIGSKDASLLD